MSILRSKIWEELIECTYPIHIFMQIMCYCYSFDTNVLVAFQSSPLVQSVRIYMLPHIHLLIHSQFFPYTV